MLARFVPKTCPWSSSLSFVPGVFPEACHRGHPAPSCLAFFAWCLSLGPFLEACPKGFSLRFPRYLSLRLVPEACPRGQPRRDAPVGRCRYRRGLATELIHWAHPLRRIASRTSTFCLCSKSLFKSLRGETHSTVHTTPWSRPWGYIATVLILTFHYLNRSSHKSSTYYLAHFMSRRRGGSMVAHLTVNQLPQVRSRLLPNPQ
jgi:hypothetical protein